MRYRCLLCSITWQIQEAAAVRFVKLLLSPVPNTPYLDKYLAQSSGNTILVKWSCFIIIGVNA